MTKLTLLAGLLALFMSGIVSGAPSVIEKYVGVYLRPGPEGSSLVLKFESGVPSAKAVYSKKDNASEIRFKAKSPRQILKRVYYANPDVPYKKVIFWADPSSSQCIVQLWHRKLPTKLPVWAMKNTPAKEMIIPLYEAKVPQRKLAAKTPSVMKNGISLNVKSDPLDKLLRSVAAEANRSMVFGDEVTGSVSVNVQNLKYEDAVDVILKPTKYRADHKGDVTVIRSAKEGLVFRVFQLKYIDVNTVVTKIQEVMKTAQATADSHTNSIFVSDTVEGINQIEQMLAQLDRIPNQVEVEAAIIQLDDSDSRDIGFELAANIATNNVGGSELTNSIQSTRVSPFDPAAAAPRGFFVGLSWKSVTGMLGALAQKTKLTVLARPRVLALNDEQASIIIGSRLGYKTTTVSATGGAVEDVKFLTVGTQLTLKPHVTENKHIIMSIKPEISDGAIDANTLLPTEKTTASETKVIAMNGQTIILGGLLRDRTEVTEKKVPILGDIPLLGFFFKGRTESTTKSEIMILLSPKIVDQTVDVAHQKEGELFLNRIYERRLNSIPAPSREERVKLNDE